MKLKNMKFVAMVAGGLLALSPALLAQDSTNQPANPPMRGMRGGPNVDQLAKTLNLTDDQKAKVKPILDDQRQKMMDLRNDSSLSREDRMAKMKTIRDDTTAKMKDALTPDQFAQYQKMSQNMRNRGQRSGGTNTPATTTPPPPPQQ